MLLKNALEEINHFFIHMLYTYALYICLFLKSLKISIKEKNNFSVIMTIDTFDVSLYVISKYH